jgi:hypothetical protein
MGAERLVVENKFWAGLTENQPVGYLDRLPAEGGAVLMFVVPSKRLPIVWAELASAAKNRERILPDPERPSADLLFARLSSTTALAATAWKAVLDSLEAAARAAGETSSAADIAQLRSLCEVMDNEAFLPVSMEELTNLEIPRRLIGLADLIPELTAKAVALGTATTTGLLPTHGWYSAGRYLRIGPNIEAWMGIDYRYWSRYGITPLWIRFRNSEGGRAPFVLEALKAWPHVFESDGEAIIPLSVLLNVARDRVLEDLLEQLRKLNVALQAADARTGTRVIA